MTPRRVLALLAAAVATLLLATWVASPRRAEHRDNSAGDLVLPGLESALNTVSEVRLARGDGTRTTLKKGSSEWTVGERDFPADSGRIRKLLLGLAALNLVEEKTRNPANYGALGVEDVNAPSATGTRIDVIAQPKSFALIVGKSSSAKSGYVRVPGAAQSVLAAPLLTVDADPKHWLDHQIIELPQERVKDIDERPAEGPAYTASRDKKEQSDFVVAKLPTGRELSGPGAADPIAGSLATLSLDDVRKPAAEPLGKRAQASFRTFDGLEVVVTGHKDGSTPWISLSAKGAGEQAAAEATRLNARWSGWEFQIPDYKYDAIFRPLEELLKIKEPPRKPAAKVQPADKPNAQPAATTAAPQESAPTAAPDLPAN